MLKAILASSALFAAASALAAPQSCQWTNDHQNFCSNDYAVAVTHDYDARNCEFYVNSFGKGGWSHNGVTVEWIDSYVQANVDSLERAQGDKVLDAGLYTAGRTFLGSPVVGQAGYFHVGMTFNQSVPTGAGPLPLEDFAFFIDVKRVGGAIDRLWIKNGTRNFDLAGVFNNYPTSEQSLGSGRILWVEGNSPIFAQKAACGR